MPHPINMLIKAALMGVVMCCVYTASAQTIPKDTIKRTAVIYNGDTLSYAALPNVYKVCSLTDKQKEARAEYNRLRNAVYVTYPYARKAGVLMNDINSHLDKIEEKKDRKAYIRTREKELRTEFTKPLTNLSVYQGKVLMKLINRETGNSCYEIIREYKGGFTAGFYQTIAFFFNTSLKQPYEPTTDDYLIERFVKEVQRLYGYAEIAKGKAS